MRKQLKQEWLNCQTIAYYSGFAGIEIKSINGYESTAIRDLYYNSVPDMMDDYVIFVAGAWCSNKTVHRSRIYYSLSGNAYFKCKGIRIPLNECMRTDYGVN